MNQKTQPPKGSILNGSAIQFCIAWRLSQYPPAGQPTWTNLVKAINKGHVPYFWDNVPDVLQKSWPAVSLEGKVITLLCASRYWEPGKSGKLRPTPCGMAGVTREQWSVEDLYRAVS